MRPYIEIDPIYMDLANCNDKIDPGKCEHFTIRGYVSEFRKKDWKRCWPFPMNESEEQLSLPPLAVPKFRRWYCEKCRQEISTEANRGNDRTYISCKNGCSSSCNCSNEVASSGNRQAPMLNGTSVSEEIDLSKPIDQSCGTNCLPTGNEIRNNAEVVQHNEIIDHDSGLENTLNHISVPLPKVDHAGLINEVYTNKIGCEANVVSNVKIAAEAGDLTNHAIGLLSLKLASCNHVAPVGDIDKVTKNDFQYHNVENSTNLIRKGTQTHSLSELLNENGHPKTDDKAITKGSSSHYPSYQFAAAEKPLIIPDKVDDQGDITLTIRGHGRKRKFLLVHEESKLGNMCFQRVDIDLISKPPQGQQKGNEGRMDVANTKAPSRFFPCASTEERIDDLPLHVLRKKNEDNSKGKGKILQADEEITTKLETQLTKPKVPFQEGTSRPQLNETYFVEGERTSFDHISNAISVNGKEVHLKEINGGGNKDKTTEVIELDSLEKYRDLATKESENGSLDDIQMEVVKFMARNQYKKSLSDRENVSGLLEKSTRMEKPQARGKRKNQKRGKHII